MGWRVAEQARAIRWLGEQNCVEVFAWLGWEHPAGEQDHAEIRGLGPNGDMTAHPGDWLIRDGEDPAVVTPMRDSVYQATGGVDA